jgi:hypothetical protein
MKNAHANWSKLKPNVARLFCKTFGHSFDSVDKLVLDITQKVAINKEQFKDDFIICKCCKGKFTNLIGDNA